jgi:hypothetical protein
MELGELSGRGVVLRLSELVEERQQRVWGLVASGVVPQGNVAFAACSRTSL